MKVFAITGYWKDNNGKDNDDNFFSEYLVCDHDHAPEGYCDDDIFFYGLSEQGIIDAIKDEKSGRKTALEFAITSYELREDLQSKKTWTDEMEVALVTALILQEMHSTDAFSNFDKAFAIAKRFVKRYPHKKMNWEREVASGIGDFESVLAKFTHDRLN